MRTIQMPLDEETWEVKWIEAQELENIVLVNEALKKVIRPAFEK